MPPVAPALRGGCTVPLRSTLSAVRPSDLAVITRTRADLASGRAREMRDSAGLTQLEAATALGVSRQALSKWERGSSAPDTAHALAYGRLLRDLARLAA